jgi:hypothetical protein
MEKRLTTAVSAKAPLIMPSIPRKLQYKNGNSQPIRVGSRYIRINTRTQYIVIVIIITLRVLMLSHGASRHRLATSFSICMYKDGSGGSMGRAR